MARGLVYASLISAVSCRPILPSQVIAGYTDQASPQKILNAVKGGANVLFWSFMEMEGNEITTKGLLQGNVTAEKIQPVHAGLVDMGRSDVIHMLSIGGWGVEHRWAGSCEEQNCSGADYASSFRSWNSNIMQKVDGFPGFAGIDWDLEGVNKLASPSNVFTSEELQIMHDMSMALRQEFVVTMVPPQSYFDCRLSSFDLSLRHPATSTVGFHYHAWNVYVALYAKCPECYDLVMVQIYEGWSRAGFDLYWAGTASNVGAAGWPKLGTEEDMSNVVLANMRCLVEGFDVDFGGFMGLGQQHVAVPVEKVVIGLGSGSWTKRNFKAPYFTATAAGDAWCRGLATDSAARIRGFTYWSISHDEENTSYAGELASAMKACSSSISI